MDWKLNLNFVFNTGDKGVLATVDGMALLELRRAIADLIVSVVVKFDEDDNEAGVSNTCILIEQYIYVESNKNVCLCTYFHKHIYTCICTCTYEYI